MTWDGLKTLSWDKMVIIRKSIVSGKTRAFDLDITMEQIHTYEGGALIQDAFPNLTADEREFMMTGITPEEWEETFGGE